jgi:peptidyl-prolyl cis-trans isomerase SurA
MVMMTKRDIGILLAVISMTCGCVKKVTAPAPPVREAGQVRLSEILIRTPQPDPDQVAAAQQKAEQVRDAVWQGGVFADLARANSQGPTAAQGEDIGYFKHGQLAQPLEDLAFRMKVGDVSDVVRTKLGFVILQVTAREDGSD